MKTFILIIGYVFLANYSFAQTISQKLQQAYRQLENDVQLHHAISSLYVIDASTGKVLFDKNAHIGLAPASTQKIITAAAAFELLSKEYRYKTQFYISNKNDRSTLVIIPSGDPTLGSGRWSKTNSANVLNRVISAVKKEVKNLSWPVYVYATGWKSGSIPDGWVWQDIGNYYGAGAEAINWKENQFDISLRSGKNIGDAVAVVNSATQNMHITSEVISAEKGSGDNAYAYYPLGTDSAVVRGTIPVNENNFIISAAFPSAKNEFETVLTDTLQQVYGKTGYTSLVTRYDTFDGQGKLIHTEVSPSLDSIIYWFLKKSINLYGEALTKTIAFEKNGYASTDSGVHILTNFWKQKGIDVKELNLYDGSGLSPFNRVTTHAEVEVLKYAAAQNWFNLFFASLPEYNGMKMKSGTINDVKSFCGYHKAKNGKDYIFSIIVNNYSGSSSLLVNKMFKVLDILK